MASPTLMCSACASSRIIGADTRSTTDPACIACARPSTGAPEAVGAQRGVVLEEAGVDQTLGQARDRGPGEPGALRQLAVAEHISAGAKRAQDLDAAFERAIGERTGQLSASPQASRCGIHRTA